MTAGYEPAWSPDGRRIAFAKIVDLGVDARIAVIRPNGGGLRYLTDGGEDSSPDWSPGGGRIAFTRSGSGICVVTVSGPRTRCIGPGGAPQWSPDGRRIIFSLRGDLAMMNPDGTGAHRILSLDRYFEPPPQGFIGMPSLDW